MRKLAAFLVLVLFLTPVLTWAQDDAPMLAMNLWMHPGSVDDIDTDASGTYLLTVSDDKTARLWDAQTGDLYEIYRVPIQKGNEGMLYSCALNPDASLMAVGGWTNDLESDYNTIYIIDVNTGEMVHRIKDLPNVISNLDFSVDGSYLVATFGGTNNPKVFTSTTWEVYAELNISDDESVKVREAIFDNYNRIACCSYDGYVYLFDASFDLIAENGSLSGQKPYSLSFTGDGTKLAVGFADAIQMQVLDGVSLELLYEPDISDIEESERMGFVAFSNDGSYLYTAGRKDQYFEDTEESWHLIRQYSNGGQGGIYDIPAAGNTFMKLLPLPNTHIAYISSEPDIGAFTPDAELVFYNSTQAYSTAVYDRSVFRVNQDASQIGFKAVGKEPFTFDVNNRIFTEAQSEHNSFVDAAGGTTVTDWKNEDFPQINNIEVPGFSDGETSRSVDISSDGSRIVFGTGWNLYCYNENAEQLWQIDAPNSVWCIGISDNDKVLVTANDDGTFNWYNIEDGSKLLSLFVSTDGKSWILWTESGYYDAAPGTENMIGWHVNNGFDQSPFFYAASQFRDIYYRPDVIDNILVTLNEDEAKRLADQKSERVVVAQENIAQMLPPTISILSPANSFETDQTQLKVQYKALSPNNEKITKIRVLIDGRPVEKQFRSAEEGLLEKTGTRTVIIPKKDCKISIMAQNQYGWSEPASVTIKYTGLKETDLVKPALYILSIGVSDYKENSLKLNYAAKDATDFADFMETQQGIMYRSVDIKRLTDELATKQEITKGLIWLEQKCAESKNNIAMIFLAGHGQNDRGAFYFLPYETDKSINLRLTAIDSYEFVKTVSNINGKVVMFLDACHSGNVMGHVEFANKLGDPANGSVVFSSSSGKQLSQENEEWGNGAFTRALIEGLKGKADPYNDKVITNKSLDSYVSSRVAKLTNNGQTPTTVTPPNMPQFTIIEIE